MECGIWVFLSFAVLGASMVAMTYINAKYGVRYESDVEEEDEESDD